MENLAGFAKVDGSSTKHGKRKASKGARRACRISRLRKPEEMSLEQWQIALRKQFARQQNLRLTNIGDEPIFSEFTVVNRQTQREYRVAIRGRGLGDNYCSCPDFAVNTLGTCKHIEWVLRKLRRRPGAKQTFAQGFRPGLLAGVPALRGQARCRVPGPARNVLPDCRSLRRSTSMAMESSGPRHTGRSRHS